MRRASDSLRALLLVVLGLADATALRGQAQAVPRFIKTSAPELGWTSVTCAADGSRMAAASASGTVYTSTNWGNAWVPTSGTGAVVVASADAKRLFALGSSSILGNGPLISSTDWGQSWSSNNAPVPFCCAATSADGAKLVASDGTWIYASTNAGGSFIQTSALSNPWRCLASSADGTRLLAAQSPWNYRFGDAVYLSTNSGATWTLSATFPALGLKSAASSADGTRLVVVGEYNYMAQSTNSGSSWTWGQFGAYNNCVACSADGLTLVSCGAASLLLTSPDGGTTWASVSPAPGEWWSVASSADGGLMAAAMLDGGVYIARTVIPPSLRSQFSVGNLRISWTVPSSGFVLQETSSLTVTNWTTVTNVPILDLTNLQNRVTIPISGNMKFYRLKSL